MISRYLRRAAVVAVAGAALVALAACGSSSSSETSSDAATQAAPSAAASSSAAPASESAATDNPGLAEAQSLVAQYSTVPEMTVNLEPLTALPEGAVVDYMECSVIQCTDVGDQLEKVAPLLGITLNRLQTGGTPETLSAAFDRAVSDKPAAVLVPATPKDLFKKQLAELEAQGSHVISWVTSDPVGDGIDAVLLDDSQYELNGKLQAAWITADSDGQANVVYVHTNISPTLNKMEETFEAELMRMCPDCTVSKLEVSPMSIGSDLPNQVVSYLQANPDTNYVVLTFGGMVLGVPEAIEAAGLSEQVKVVSQAGLNLNFEYIKEGGQAVDLTLSHLNLAYAILDAAARAINGQSLDNVPPILPGMFLTQENLDFDPQTNTTWPMPEDLQAAYKAAWGIS